MSTIVNKGRIYLVSVKQLDDDSPAATERLVRAQSQAQAINYVIRKLCTAAPASRNDLVRLIGDVAVEDVNE